MRNEVNSKARELDASKMTEQESVTVFLNTEIKAWCQLENCFQFTNLLIALVRYLYLKKLLF